MCTLIVLDRVVPRIPLVVASNRDEYLSRPAAPPARIQPRGDRNRAFVAPQDLDAGGTWMGVNARGVFVGLTNRPTEARRDDCRSRGLLVMDALECGGVREVVAQMQDGLEGRYNPFNLLYSDGRGTFVTSLDERRAHTRALEPGVQILCNRDVNDLASPKTAKIRDRVAAIDLKRPFEEIFRGLAEILACHDDPEGPGVCVHSQDYGTRSSAIFALGGPRQRLWYADGPPCQTKYRNHSALLDELRQPADPKGETR